MPHHYLFTMIILYDPTVLSSFSTQKDKFIAEVKTKYGIVIDPADELFGNALLNANSALIGVTGGKLYDYNSFAQLSLNQQGLVHNALALIANYYLQNGITAEGTSKAVSTGTVSASVANQREFDYIPPSALKLLEVAGLLSPTVLIVTDNPNSQTGEVGYQT